jgi:hypothetical protein
MQNLIKDLVKLDFNKFNCALGGPVQLPDMVSDSKPARTMQESKKVSLESLRENNKAADFLNFIPPD